MSRDASKRSGLPIIHEFAAGIDIGARFYVVAVPPHLTTQPVQSFQAFTADLHRLADWLVDVGITTVAMESTGVYWVPVFEILEDRGIDVILANARDAKVVPGRKTDVNDAQWLQRLHACGLLRASFRPGRDISALRTYLRLRVVTDVTGATGMKIIRAIVAGERDPEILVAMRNVRCKASAETVRAALCGNYQPEHVFALAQALSLYDFYQARVDDCDVQIERALAALSQRKPLPAVSLPKARHRTRQPNALNFDVRSVLYQMIGVDLTQIHGIGPYLALRLISECGTDLGRWPSAKHFTSWLTLSPGSKISGGKVLSAHTRKTTNRLTAYLRLAAVTVGRTDTALGAFYRRLAARIGKAKAVTATARKIAVLFYNSMRFGMAYQDPGADQYERNYRDRVVKNLHRRAADFGYTLQVAEGVS